MGWSTARVFRDRNASLYLGGVLVSGFGDSAMSLAAGVWIKTLTGSDSLAALVGAAVWLPTLLGPVLGVVADRVRRRRLLVATNLALAAVMTAPAGVRAPGQVWLLFAALALVGAGAVLIDAAETALLVTAVPEDLRSDFNGLTRTAVESMKLLAPVAGVGLFTAFGGPAVALLNACTFAGAALAFMLLRLREPAPHPTGGASWGRRIADGAAFLRHEKTLLPAVLAGAVAMVASSLSSTATFALLDDGLHRSPTFAGVLTPVQGLGSIITGLAAGTLLRRLRGGERAFAALGLAAFAIGALARATPWTPLVVAGSLAIGLGLPAPLIAAVTAVQRLTPDRLLGRVAGTASTAMFAPTGLALLLGSAAVAVLDYRVQTVVAAALAGTTALLIRPRLTPGSSVPL